MEKIHTMMIIQVDLNTDFMRKNILPAPRFEPKTFQIVPSRLGITFLSGMSISP